MAHVHAVCDNYRGIPTDNLSLGLTNDKILKKVCGNLISKVEFFQK